MIFYIYFVVTGDGIKFYVRVFSVRIGILKFFFFFSFVAKSNFCKIIIIAQFLIFIIFSFILKL